MAQKHRPRESGPLPVLLVPGWPGAGVPRIIRLAADTDLRWVGDRPAFRRVLTREEVEALEDDIACPFAAVPTSSPAVALLARHLRRLAAAPEDLLVVGETGVGKEVLARAIHRASGRRGAFVALNCAALPRELIESELYGYERGAHSQAVRSKEGFVALAEGGTLFLDELGEMPFEAQAKLLRFVQERDYYRLGGITARKADVRLIAASNRSAAAEPPFGLRPDLAARFGSEGFAIPPLRDRREDIGNLLAHFMRDSDVTVSPAAAERLFAYRWPGNVRELEAVIRRAHYYLDPGQRELDTWHLPQALRNAAASGEVGRMPKVFLRRRPRRPAPSREELQSLMASHRGNIAAVARALDRHWRVVYRWVKATPTGNGLRKGG